MVPDCELDPNSVPCGPGQHLDALDVDQPHVDLLRARRHRLVVEIDRDLAVRVVLARAGRDAAHDDVVAARDGVDERDAWQCARDVVQRLEGLLGMSSVESAVTLCETSCRFTSRRVAVTMTGVELARPRVRPGRSPSRRDSVRRKWLPRAGSSGQSLRNPQAEALVCDRCNTLNERTTGVAQEVITSPSVCQAATP